MPYSKISDSPPSWQKINDVKLTLSQINWISKVFDALQPQEKAKKIKSAAAVAINQFKKSFQIVDGKWQKIKKEESDELTFKQFDAIMEEISGGLKEFEQKLQDALRKHIDRELYVRDIIPSTNTAIYIVWGKQPDYQDKTYQVTFIIDSEGGNIAFGTPEEIELKEVIVPVAEETPKISHDELIMEETVEQTDEGEQLTLTGNILLEEKEPVKDKTFAIGKMPMVNFGKLTNKKNRYTEECWDWLEIDIRRLCESKSSGNILDMYPTHKPALDKWEPDYFTKKAGKLTGASKEGNIGFIHFETLATQVGKDMAVLLHEGMVDGGSLRAYPKNAKLNSEGGHDVFRMNLVGCDFTNVGSMPFEEKDKGIQLEEKEVIEMTEEEKKKLESKLAEAEKKAKAAEDKAKLLEEKNKDHEKQLAEEAKRRRQASLLEHANEIIDKFKEQFGETIRNNILAETKTAIASIMEEFENDVEAKAKIDEKVNGLFEQRKKEIAEAMKVTMKNQKDFLTNPNVVSTLTTEARQVGLTEEMTGGSKRIRDLLLAKVFNQPVYKDGRFLLEEWDDRLKPLIDQQIYYMNHVGHQKNDLFAVGGQVHNMMLSEEMQKQIEPLLLEANEATTTGVISTNLPTEVAAAIIYAAWPDTIAMQIAATGDMKSSTKDIFEVGYPTSTTEVFKRGQHEFGWVDEANATTLVTTTASPTTYGDFVDQDALSASDNEYADHLYARCIEVPSDNMVITWTGTDENGDSATWTVTFTASDSAGDIKRCTPTNIGQKCTDITAVSVAGTLSSGQVGVFVEKPITGATAGSAEDLSYLGITKAQATADDYDLGARLDIALIEDMQMAMKDTGGGLDYLALMVSVLKKSITDQVDRKILYEIVDDSTGGSQTYANGTLPAGYTQAEWDAKFNYYCGLTATETQYAGNFVPNYQVWSLADEPRFMDWLREAWIKYDPSRTGPYLQSRAIGNAAGCDIFASPNARRNRVAFGTKGVGVHYYVYVPFVVLGPQWVPDSKTKAVMLHHRAALKVTQARTLGKLTIS